MNFLAPTVTFLAPCFGPAGWGALAGGGVAAFNQLSKDKVAGEPAPTSIISEIAKSALKGMVVCLSALGCLKLGEQISAIFISQGITATGLYTASKSLFFSLPFAAQIGIPIVLGILVAGVIAAIAFMNRKPSNPDIEILPKNAPPPPPMAPAT